VKVVKDEVTRTCVKCGSRTINPPVDFGCVGYCQFVEQCLGDLIPGLFSAYLHVLCEGE